MAFERKQSDTLKIKGDSLDAFVSNLSRTFSDQMAIRNAQEEATFQQRVLEDNLTLDDQLAYRKQQLKDVSDDPQEKTRIKTEISGLKDRIEQKAFSDAYTQKIINYNAGAASVDSVISWLKDQLSTATDQSVIDSINKELTAKSAEKFTITQNILTDQTNFALNDKTVPVLDAQLNKVQSARTAAMLAGNDAQVAALDLQIQGLTQAKTEAAVTADINNFAVTSITGYATATKLLDSYNSKIQSSAGSGPVTIGGVRYDSEQQFWQFKRDTYLSDNSGSGFFPQITAETNDNIKTLSSQNLLDKGALASAITPFNDLTNRPELASYTTQITNARQQSLQTGADLITTKVIENNYSNTLDLNKAVADLTALKALGVNVEDSYAKILSSASATKTSQVSGILSAAQNAMQNNPGLTAEQAIQQAVAAGAGSVISPVDAAGKTETQIATAGAATAKLGTGSNDPRTTVTPPAAPAAPAGSPNTPAPSTPNTSTYSGPSIVDYLTSVGHASDYSSRAKLAKDNGIINYTGTADQNSQLLTKLRSTPAAAAPSTAVVPAPVPTPAPAAPAAAPAAPVNTPKPAAPTPAPTPSPSPAPAAPSSGGSGYTFVKEGTNVGVFQGGQRVSTASLDYAKTLGYTGT